MIRKMIPLIVVLSITSCRTKQFPSVDPEAVCKRIEGCYSLKKRDIPVGFHDMCVVAVRGQDSVSDAYYADCDKLGPCGFTICMGIHSEAAKTARRLSGEDDPN